MKLLIVDDEIIIRKGLSTVLNWSEIGIEVLTPAASAEEALNRIPIERPQIVFTDIRMGAMNGLELAAAIQEAWSYTEVIILTGYDEFTYAQQALRAGVSDYLLKSSRPDEIMRTAVKAKQRILSKWELLKQDHMQQSAFRSRLFEQLVVEGESDALVIQQAATIFKKLKCCTRLNVACIRPSGWEEYGLLLFAVSNMLYELLECEIWLSDGHLVVIISSLDAFQLALTRLMRKLKCSLYAAVGSSVSQLEQLHTSYKEAAYVLDFQPIFEPDQFVDYDQIKGRVGGRTVCSREEEGELAAILNSGGQIELRQWIHQMVQAQLSDEHVTPISLTAFLNSIIISGHRWLERMLHASRLDQVQLCKPPETFTELSEMMEESLFKSMSVIMETHRVEVVNDRFSYVQRSMNYIRSNLDQSLTLKQVARYVHLNPNHFSEVFKRETGLTYLEFVTRERMHRAVEILNESSIKISQVAKEVGYEDIKYFSQQFKKYMGKTPSEYRHKY
ncbi:response regulator [Paenibacillus sp. N1-5-1-14]|uniref:AraC family transcriptional regulator n=1 Tax=Paenibacillus radicibacter TaxID=2972488 RepID=UPI0021591197|nr:response regulator [Paenibacillus radicibacter]MCR8642488.1 response regulator [Paenibacillus radicibacter]